MIFAIRGRFENIPSQGPFDHRYYITTYFARIFDELNILLFPVMSSDHATEFAGVCDGLIVPGSFNDIHPSYYGRQPEPGLSYEIDEFSGDRRLIMAFAEKEKPIIGICGGLQSINVTFGGTLHQRVKDHFIDDGRHDIILKENSFLRGLYGRETISVNSFHNQAVDTPAPGFSVSAVSADGVIEAIEKDNIIGVQWHPEVLGDVDFFRSFLEKHIR